ncbi:hypothetical protein [Vallitalea okinawensis]|uniref:hypothetical protein n=1 Tax=Vallitalea okinawensis TaxID=2078660 RepID=UPI000CFB5FE5|nr:hypothetical protein [Vallitalea okinawensis]
MTNKQGNKFWIIPLFIVLAFTFPMLSYSMQLVGVIVVTIISVIQYFRQRKKEKYPRYVYFSGFYCATTLILTITFQNNPLINKIYMVFLLYSGIFAALIALIVYMLSGYKKYNDYQKTVVKTVIITFIISMILILIIFMRIISMNR